MSRTILKSFLVVAILLLAVWLFRDSTVFALRKPDPVTGRGRGCYTELEILLGIKYPTEWIRLAELAGGGILTVSAVTIIIRWRNSQ